MKKILLVDDERNVHYSLQRALGEAFRIISAFSGEEALQKLVGEKAHLVLLDVKLPGLGGLDILQHIKARDRELPVCLLTAYGTTETAITAMKLGAYDYLLKPVDIATLKGIIAASNKNLEAAIVRGEFREDLYYRLNVIHFHLPPLRARQEDIPLLANYFLTRSGQGLERPVGGFRAESLGRLLTHSWPGNVRELENTINQALLTCR